MNSRVSTHDADTVFGGRFRADRVLKQGRNSETLLGTDLLSGDAVVIKTLAAEAVSPSVQMQLEHETDILRTANHPQATAPLAAGRTDGAFFVVLPYHDGPNLAMQLAEGPLATADAMDLMRSLLATLQEIHARGVLHRDIKPSNVMLPAAGVFQQAKLVDFGMAHSWQVDETVDETPLDSIRYVSPEQVGLLDAEVSECSDLYSLGVMLWHCLSGRSPYNGRTVHEVLRQHLTVQPPELRSVGIEVPGSLDEVLQRMLRKDPRERYQTAGAALADVTAIGEALLRGESEPSIVIGLHDRRTSLTEPAFVGRGPQLQGLNRQLRSLCAGRAGMILLEAESGGGKTRLLGEWALRIACEGVWVLRGQTVDQVVQRPFQILEGIADEIVAVGCGEPAIVETVRERLGDMGHAAAAAIPKLAELWAVESSTTQGPDEFGERRSIQALVALLRSLGTRSRPVVVILDDCQWADESTLKLLQRWHGGVFGHDSMSGYVSVVVAFRSEEVGPSSPLRELDPALHIRLPPFTKEDTCRLAESMAGALPEEAMRVIERLSEGSPFMASAVLHGMVESGALVAESVGWRVEPAAMKDLRSSRHAAGLLARRIQLLPVVAADLLKTAAVLGKEFDLELAASLAGLLPRHAMIALKQAQNRHLVWGRPDLQKFTFVHDKVRESFHTLLTQQERQDLQRRAAKELEKKRPLPIFDLAFLFDAAGDSERALPYALRAADQAREQHALEVAEQQYSIAVRGSVNADNPTRFRIAQGLGDVLMLRGRYDRAAQMFEAAKFIAADMEKGQVPRAAIQGKLGELAFKRGEMMSARESNERALEMLGAPVPAEGTACVIQLLREVGIQVLHTLFPRFFIGRCKQQITDGDRVAIQLYSRLAYVYWFCAGKIPCLWTHLRGLNLAERFAPDEELAQAYANHGPVMSLVPWFGRAIRYSNKSLEIHMRLHDPWGLGQSYHFYGIVLYAAARWEECIVRCRESVRLLERTGDFWEMHFARYQIAASLYRLGDLAAAIDEAKRLYQSAIELGDFQSSGISLDIWSWATEGKVPEEALRKELARNRYDAQATAQVLVAEGVCQLSHKRPATAVEALERARQAVIDQDITNAWVAPVRPWLATALRRQAASLTDHTLHGREALLSRAEQVLREAMPICRKFQNDLPHALREKAIVAAMRGRLGRARRIFRKGLAVADRLHAKYDRALLLKARGEIGKEVGWEDASLDLDEAERLLFEIRAGGGEEMDEGSDSLPVSLSLVDRFDTVLKAGREIASALTRDAIFQAVREAGVSLLRGEQCSVFLCAEADRAAAQGLTDEGVLAFAKSAKEAGGTQVFSSDAEVIRNEPLATAGIRSAICTPIFVRGQATACFYVSHRRVAGLFRDDEQRLIEFVATIAGAALENAEGFGKLRELNVTLEQRVAERTADLDERSRDLARSNAELERFAYVASHDLQEPLRVVRQYCERLQKQYADRLDDDAREFIAHAVDGAERMRTLIRDLLAYSRAGTRSGPLEPTNCEEVLQRALHNLKLAVAESDAVVTHDPLPVVVADAGQLTQVLQNLVGNALKFRSTRRPEIHVSVQRGEAVWIFSVADNGIGIDKDSKERIFLIFQRLHSRDKYEGTGIGLAICKRCVARLGGEISVESEVCQGSTFFFTLPDAQAENPPAKKLASSGRA